MEERSKSFLFYIDFLPKVTSYSVGATIICYFVGFVISNMYLGSLGVENFEVIRIRYIVVGILFLVFMGAIAFLVVGFWITLYKYILEPSLKLVSRLVWYSLENLIPIYLVIIAIYIITGRDNILPFGLPNVTNVTSFAEWLNYAPRSIFTLTTWVIILILPFIYLTITIVILINPKDKNGKRRSRKEQFRELLKWDKKSIWNTLGIILLIFIFIFVLLLLLSLLNFISTNNLHSSVNLSMFLPEGWAGYFGGIALIYCIVAIWLAMFALLNKNSANESVEGSVLSSNPIGLISSKIYFVAIAIILILPLYSFRIYSVLPQQMGGGQPIEVELLVSDDELNAYYTNPDIETYLIDRATDTTLVLSINNVTEDYKVEEIPNTTITRIIYQHP